MLHADPELVHLGEIVQHNLNRVIKIARLGPEMHRQHNGRECVGVHIRNCYCMTVSLVNIYLSVNTSQNHTHIHTHTYTHTNPRVLIVGLGQVRLDSMEQVVAQEQAPKRMLHTAAHFNQILENRARRAHLAANKHSTNGHQQVQTRDYVACCGSVSGNERLEDRYLQSVLYDSPYM